MHSSVQGRLAVNDVLGLKASDGDELQALLEKECGAQVVRLGDVRSAIAGGKVSVARESWAGLKGSKEDRGRMIEDIGEFDKLLLTGSASRALHLSLSFLPHKFQSVIKGTSQLIIHPDSKLYQHLHALSTGPKYTVIFLSTPASNIAPESTAEKAIIYEPKFMEPLHMDLKRDIYARERNESGTVDQRPLFEKYNFLSPGMFFLPLLFLISQLGHFKSAPPNPRFASPASS